MQVDGQCLCGAIAYEATVDPAKATICHCTACQTLSGAPFRASAPAKAEDFHIRKGSPRVYVKIADSGARRAQGFCGDCGTPIYATSADDPKIYNLRLGPIRQRAQIPPQRQIWCDSSLDWAKDIRGLPGVPKG
ncbi:MAG TPA: GFA family protein [Rhizomicrobium sp.]|nr:GFA family protein [Rhizomicrobium sp.]